MPYIVTTPSFVVDLGIEGAGRAVIEQRHLDLGGDGSVINLFAYRLRLIRGLGLRSSHY
ncbi:MAG: hypothetical protein MZV70_64700 [Desulfobacterales bacterium]|nr:hypothetical protein [Desulfobacterales bacterium]